jgi:hypothetical protein
VQLPTHLTAAPHDHRSAPRSVLLMQVLRAARTAHPYISLS